MKMPDVTDLWSVSWRQPLTGRRPARIAGAMLVLLLCLAAPVLAADPTYSGDLLSRSTLTGDWAGVRNDLARKGVTFDAYLTQVAQGAVSGGTDSSWKYGGHGVLTLTVDAGKLGLWPGGFLSAEMEGNSAVQLSAANSEVP
jgi:carbohydrate-selective porin OprB